jgi:hypothetical protein
MSRFSGIPSVPLTLGDEQLARVLAALKENVELLTNQRNEGDRASAAITGSSISVSTADNRFQGLSARGVGTEVSNVGVPLLSDYVKLLQDFQSLAYDVAALRDTVNTLISQLRRNT